MPTPIWQLSIDGADVSSNFGPVLISMTIHETEGGKADTLEIELDDTDGQIALPSMGAEVDAAIGWDDTGATATFIGYIGAVASKGKGHGDAHRHSHHKKEEKQHGEGAHSAGDRSKGRTLTLTATSADMRSDAKGHVEKHMDNSSFQDAATSFASDAGLSVNVDPTIGAINRTYWGIANESFLEWGARIATDIGATFKVYGTNAVFVPRDGNTSASGEALVDIDATWGDNLISWSISPILSRNDYAEFGARWYDMDGAQWNREAATSDSSDGVTAKHTGNYKSASQDHATLRANSSKSEGKRDKGGGDNVVIQGEPDAQVQANCNVSGVRDGVDGTYTIAGVTHHLTRHGSFTTELSLKQPSGDAGTDSRNTTSSAASGQQAPGVGASDPNAAGSGLD
jgi:uncharacterized protein